MRGSRYLIEFSVIEDLLYYYRRASCGYVWNTPEGGPCVMRPIQYNCYDAPSSDKITNPNCFTGVDSDGKCIPHSGYSSTGQCKNAVCDENNVVHNPTIGNVQPQITGPFSEDMSAKEKQYRHNCGWSNEFAFPYEIGMYWNLTTAEGMYNIRYVFGNF